MRLTVRGVEALQASDKRQEIPDSLMMGLYLIVQPGTGNKTWAVRCRQNGRPRKFTIGRYPAYGLAEARDAAARVLRTVSEGRARYALMPVPWRISLPSSCSATANASTGQKRSAR
jgi:hypothetical protein